jgi:hypothetical protein
MPVRVLQHWKTWAVVLLFFGIGVGIALLVAFAYVRRGGSPLAAIAAGAFCGGYGAYSVFYVALNVLHWLGKHVRSAGA